MASCCLLYIREADEKQQIHSEKKEKEKLVFLTSNHGLFPEQRTDNIPSAIHIGKKVWIGSHATILPGVTIGDNAIVAAGAVVNHDIPSYQVWGGIPAHYIRDLK